jgi:hypothetical protein
VRPLNFTVSGHLMRQQFRPGTATCIASDSLSSPFSAVFEDDGATAYFYAYDRGSDPGVLDALHIYTLPVIVNPDGKWQAEIQWSPDGLKAGLLINDKLHAIIDFQAHVAYSRYDTKPPAGAWASAARAPWRDELASLLR